MLGSEGSIDPRPWPRVVCAGMVIDETGLAFRDGPLLSRMVDGTLALAEDRERVTALLSVAYRRPMPESSLDHIDAAADYWRRGDKALANLRLIFAGLPRLEDAGDLARLHAAEWLLDQGLAPHVLMKELGLDPAAPDLAKYDPDQPRVPAGHGRESGRWGPILAGITDWLNEPVPEYDQDTGEEVGTRSRGYAIATNPITAIVAGAAALVGSEVLLAGEAAALASGSVAVSGETAVSETAKEIAIAALRERGLASEARVLEDLGLIRNTKAVTSAEGSSIPDALTDTMSIEIKDAQYVGRTAQIRIQTYAARSSGRQSILITGENTRVSAPASNAFDLVLRRPDLGPR